MTAARASVDHRVALADQDVQIEFAGFPPGEPVTVTATQVFRASRWQAKATFRADAGGQVSIARHAPISGTYTDVSAMGLFWSAGRLPDPIVRPPDDWILAPWQVRLEAIGGDGARAELVLDRAAGPRRHAADRALRRPGGGFPTGRRTEGRRHRAGRRRRRDRRVLGRDARLARLCRAQPRLLQPARPAARPGQHPAGVFRERHPLDEEAALARRPAARRLGPSRGGELALLLGATFPDINAVAAWVPSGVMFWGIGPNDAGDDRASWTFRGKPLPYLQQDNLFAATVPALERGRPIAYAPIYRSHLQDRRAFERATIPVERIRGPVQLVSGADDQMWPSAELADIAFHRLQAQASLPVSPSQVRQGRPSDPDPAWAADSAGQQHERGRLRGLPLQPGRHRQGQRRSRCHGLARSARLPRRERGEPQGRNVSQPPRTSCAAGSCRRCAASRRTSPPPSSPAPHRRRRRAPAG